MSHSGLCGSCLNSQRNAVELFFPSSIFQQLSAHATPRLCVLGPHWGLPASAAGPTQFGNLFLHVADDGRLWTYFHLPNIALHCNILYGCKTLLSPVANLFKAVQELTLISLSTLLQELLAKALVGFYHTALYLSHCTYLHDHQSYSLCLSAATCLCVPFPNWANF